MIASNRALVGAVIGAFCLGAGLASGAVATDTSSKTDTADSSSDRLQEVIVTAQKRRERALDVPISLTTFNSVQMEQRDILDLDKLASYTPGLEVTPDPGGGAELTLRGVTSSVGGVGVDPSVGVYEDGVYIARDWVALQSYLDIDRVEVLRGPQGTLYGRNTTGGAYNIYHKLPTNDLEAGASVEETGYESGGLRQRYQAFISGPLIADKVLARLSVSRDKDEDYTRNLYTGYRAPEDQTQALGTLEIRPFDGLTITLRADIANDSGRVGSNYHVIRLGTDNVSADVPASPYQYRSDFPGTADYLHNRGFSANVEWDIAGGYQLKSITGGRTILINTQYDSDGTELPIYTAVLNDQSRTLSQEFQIISPADRRLDWLGGLYFYHENAHDLTTSGGPYPYGPFYLTTASGADLYSAVTGQYLSLNIPFDYRGVFDSTNITKSYAAFGQLRFKFTEQLQGTLGLRYTDEQRTFSGNAGTAFVPEGASGVYGYNPATACQSLIAANPVTDPAGTTAAQAQATCVSNVTEDMSTYSATAVENRSPTTLKFNNVSWRFVLDYHLTHDTHVYASVATGFKSGGFNSYDTDAAYSGSRPGQPGVPVISYQPPFGPEKLISYEAGIKGVALEQRLQYSFDYWYYNWSNIQAQLYNYLNSSSDVTNDAKAKAQGPEFDLLARPWSNGTIDFNGAYIDGYYTHFGANFSDVVTSATNQSFQGFTILGTPKWKWNLGIQQTVALNGWGSLTPRAEYQHQASTYWVFTHDPLARSGGYDIYNFRLDYQAPKQRFDVNLYVENLTNRYYDYYRFGTSTTGIEGVVAPPRTFGIRVSADF
ncbi:MAG TPA: TonB-dependent receptor [Steroidobacteraceae bacterium]